MKSNAPAELTRKLLIFLIFAAFLASAACSRDKGGEEASAGDGALAAPAPPIRVHPDERHIYRYFPAGEARPKTVKSISDVPKEARDLVLVVPDEVSAPAGMTYVADLREERGDGSYPVRVVASAELERTLAETRGPAAAEEKPPEPNGAPGQAAASGKGQAAASAPSGVIMFSTSWCGVCAQARRWLRNKDIQFVEKDVEKLAGAREEMERLAAQAGLPKSQLRGVPIFWVNGHMLPGFDAAAIERALGSS